MQVPNVTHAASFLEDAAVNRATPHLPSPEVQASQSLVWKTSSPDQTGKPFQDFQIPFANTVSKIPHLHWVNFDKDSDGAYRRAPLYFKYALETYPSLHSRRHDAISQAGRARGFTRRLTGSLVDEAWVLAIGRLLLLDGHK